MIIRSYPVAICILLAFFSSEKVYAEESIDFNTDVLDVKDRSNIDLNHFSRKGYLMPGQYRMTVRLNNAELPEHALDFYVPENDPNGSSVCLTHEVVKEFGLKDAVSAGLTWWHGGQCMNLESLKGMTVRPDLGSNSLYINLPQAYLEYTAENWDPPSRWDNGIPGVLFDYSVSAMTTKRDAGNRTQNVSGNGTTGANMGPWRLRADWQAEYERQNGAAQRGLKKWTFSRYYLYRAITSLKAKLAMGESYLDSTMFDSFRYTGANLESDDQQLPPNLRGYSPEVTGVARTNAKVTVSQQGRVLYETTVAAGPFRIQDLNSSVAGKLDVKIQEQDGSVQTFQVDTASVPYLTRPGLVRYKISMGKPSDYQHHAEGGQFGSGEFSWGINNGWSLYGGGVFAGQYNALALGIGRDLLALGALSFDVTQSRAELPQIGTRSGGSYRLSYSKLFEEYDSQVTFAGYRFSERNFMGMSQYLDAKYHNGTQGGEGKELYTITMNKQFRKLNMSAFLTYSHQNYWDRESSDRWNLSLSNHFDIGQLKDVSLNLSAYRSLYNGVKDDGLFVEVSLPWGNNGSISYSGQYGGNTVSHSASYYSRIDKNNNYRVSAGSTHDGQGTGSGYITHQGDMAEISANTSFQNSKYNAVGLSAQGGITATTKGIALHRSGISGGTRMMVDTEGVSGVPVHSYGADTYSNYFGKAVLSDINSYYRSNIDVDLDHLPDNIDATQSVVEDTLTEGAIGYRKFGILAGEKAMALLRLADGSVPPFGATVTNIHGEQTGIVSDDGTVWLSGMMPGESMNVSWNDEVQCRIVLPHTLSAHAQKLLLPCGPLKDKGTE